MAHVHEALIKIYALFKSSGDVSVIEHLYIDRIDLCTYGNTKPFRVRIVNRINDLFDYFYIKIADASRVYGLELEHLISPSKINFWVSGETLVEEHIQGIPGDDFIKHHLKDQSFHAMRLAKEFVKFNERCLVRLLGDMHSSNFVIEIIPDFDEIYYRIRAIDFDQQSYEGKRPFICHSTLNKTIQSSIWELTVWILTLEMQYQKEERSLIANQTSFQCFWPRNTQFGESHDERRNRTGGKCDLSA